MVNDLTLADNFESRSTKILTASGSANQITGKYGVLQKMFFPSGGTEVKAGKEGKAVFSEKLGDNLASVGRLCECGFVVVFDEGMYRIYRADSFSVRGVLVHTQR